MRPVPELVLEKLQWLRQEQIWPNGLRYLWTDAFGVVLLVSLFQALGEEKYLHEAEWVVAEVERVLGRTAGIRIGEAPDRDGQYFHYLAMWLFALDRLGRVKDEYRLRGIDLAQQIHHRFVVPGLGVYWKMREDLSGPYPGIGFGALDAFHGYVVYRLLAPDELAAEIAQMGDLVRASYRVLSINQDLGLGMMLWLTHFFPAGALGADAAAAVPGEPGPPLGGAAGIFLPVPRHDRHLAGVQQLWRFSGTAGRRAVAGTGAGAARFFRHLPLRG